ncbi:STAS/SEC14 domain-containing protein [Pleurocapsales cyanobacterium LEGE 10410]|nr:STAS/SEC14 domain-containing protein [Pleurocapsales cyanobacterium LEGE 10410]
MITYQKNSDNNIVEICVDGQITEADFERLANCLKADINEHGELRLLEEVRYFEGVDPITLLKDILFGLSPVNDFTHAAVVIDAEWMSTYIQAIDNVLFTKVKAFDSAEIEDARNWLANS